MKCSACGKENVQNARFCAFCGEKITAEAPAQEQTAPSAGQETSAQPVSAARQTARPLTDNPYMPPRSPVIPSAQTAKPDAANAGDAPAQSKPSGPRQIIKPSEKRIFLFDEEQEEADAQIAAEDREADYDEFSEYEDDEEDELYEDEEDEPRGGRIFVHVISALTVIILIAGVISFLYGTTIGRRLRASVGRSGEAADYVLLADWQLSQHSLSDASASYYNAFKLDQDNYELALTVGTGFENASDLSRAEQLYTYMIETYPQADEPYDRLMALLNRQGRTEQYEALLLLRAEKQPGYLLPSTPAPDSVTVYSPTGSCSTV